MFTAQSNGTTLERERENVKMMTTLNSFKAEAQYLRNRVRNQDNEIILMTPRQSSF
jgi:hypothetical protein